MSNNSRKEPETRFEIKDIDVLYKHHENRKVSSGQKTNFFGIPLADKTSVMDTGMNVRSNSTESTDSNIYDNSANNLRKPSLTQMITGIFRSPIDSEAGRKVSLDEIMSTRRRESINGDGFSREDYMTKNLVDSLQIGKPKF
uniref:Uncharacterized protein n=1 Tax=Strongyloides papillosus TaxID=174720 RepID=A0A0N5B1V7_STREA